MNSPRLALSALLLGGLLLLMPNVPAQAGTATWNRKAGTGDWNKAKHWTPNSVPDSSEDVATFGTSQTVALSLSKQAEVNQIVFNPGGSAFTITVASDTYNPLVLSGVGITNNSGVTQNFVSLGGSVGYQCFVFKNVASAGTLTQFTNSGGTSDVKFTSGSTFFYDSSSAANATVINEGGTSDIAYGGGTGFLDSSTAANATLINQPGITGWGGITQFSDHATAGNAVIRNEAGPSKIDSPAQTLFIETATAGDSMITNEGATTLGDVGGSTTFINFSTAGNATLIANNSIAGQPAFISFGDSSTGGTARIVLFGNGSLFLANQQVPVTIGSLEGDGQVFLSAHILIVGANNLSKAFSGLIQGNGSLVKIGTGTLTLSGANTYNGTTTVVSGSLKVSNQSGSATSTGPVQVDGGTLGGGGMIGGAVTIGTGSGGGSYMAPGIGASEPTTLTIQDWVIFNEDGTYTYKVNTKKAKGDQVVANGVAIENGAQLGFNAVANRKLTAGTAFTAINNTSATPISGTFSNLPDGSTFTAGRNNFQVSYAGGDGNDLTLTVVP